MGLFSKSKETKAKEAFFDAARQGDLATLTRLMNEGVSVYTTNTKGETALMLAAGSGKLGCVNHLIAKGANITAKDDFNNNALLYVIYDAHGEAAVSCLKSLLEAGADTSAKGMLGMTALQLAKAFDTGNAKVNGQKLPKVDRKQIIELLENAPEIEAQAAANRDMKVQGLAPVLASLNLSEHLANADAWCVSQGAEKVTDLKFDTFAEQLAASLKLPPIIASKLVHALKEA